VREPSRADKKERRKRKEKYEGKTNKGKKERKNKDIYGYFTILSTTRSHYRTFSFGVARNQKNPLKKLEPKRF
jgi:hypothetical protein